MESGRSRGGDEPSVTLAGLSERDGIGHAPLGAVWGALPLRHQLWTVAPGAQAPSGQTGSSACPCSQDPVASRRLFPSAPRPWGEGRASALGCGEQRAGCSGPAVRRALASGSRRACGLQRRGFRGGASRREGDAGTGRPRPEGHLPLSQMGVPGEHCAPRHGAGGLGPCEDGPGGWPAGAATGPGPSLALACFQTPELTQTPAAAAEGRA